MKKIKHVLARMFIHTIGRLSDGIQLCLNEGLTSGIMVDYIYQNQPSGKWGIGKYVDRKFLSDPGWEAVRLRRRHFETLLLESIEDLRRGKHKIYLLDIASGPAAYIISAMLKSGHEDIFALCQDIDERWIEKGRKEAKKQGLANLIYRKGDAFNEEALLSITPSRNLVAASGFYDWINDEEQVKSSMRIINKALERGGYFVLSFQSAHPKLEFTQAVFTDFYKQPLQMTMRTKEVIHQWLLESGFKVDKTLHDPKGYYHVIKASKV